MSFVSFLQPGVRWAVFARLIISSLWQLQSPGSSLPVAEQELCSESCRANA